MANLTTSADVDAFIGSADQAAMSLALLAVPGPIGGTTPDTAAFTTLSALSGSASFALSGSQAILALKASSNSSSSAGSFYFDGPDTANASYAAFGNAGTGPYFGVTGYTVLSSSKNGSGTQKPITLGGYSGAFVHWATFYPSGGVVIGNTPSDPGANTLALLNGSAAQTFGMGPATTDGILLKQSNGGNVSFRNGDDSSDAAVTSGTLILPSGGELIWSGGTANINAIGPAGCIRLGTTAATINSTFDRLQFGGIDATYPALKRSGTGLQARLADDSGPTTLVAINIPVADTGWTANADAGDKTSVIPSDAALNAMQAALNLVVAGFGDAFVATADKCKALEAVLATLKLPNA